MFWTPWPLIEICVWSLFLEVPATGEPVVYVPGRLVNRMAVAFAGEGTVALAGESVIAPLTARLARQELELEGKGHAQALIALTRRLVDVIWALLRDSREFHPSPPVTAAAVA
ncbi:hypothetical protein AB0F52_24370 [Amycolatopsis sp. NPDC024027]|uniref:hypothetical protein n=1 Tax=Amycolatopsis sp. NPDC024027 TaxID=3154327 RepID=UPI0033CB4AC0